MLERQVTICNRLGLHARAAAKFVTLATRYSSNIELRRESRTVNGKSIMGVMMLAAAQGTELTLIIHGDDELDAMTQIESLINDRFGEHE